MPDGLEHSDSRKTGSGPTDTAPAPRHLSELGDYELRREVGRGGMGTVYEAWQKSLQRVVALKLLAPHISSSPKAVLRFQREAQAAAKLHHTHIVPIFAQGEMDGHYFYAMEFISGESLSDIIAEYRRAKNLEPASDVAETVVLHRGAMDGSGGAGPPATSTRGDSTSARRTAPCREEYGTPEFFRLVAEHMACIADALEYAHRQGVIHRDIKPHNLLLGEDGRMRISDFGLARLSQQPGVTITGEMIGSPLYMSPEQITGDPNKVDHRADIYSLGATLYEWLTLRPPYPGETREQVIGRILSSEASTLRASNPDIPIDLETMALKAIEREPGRRYQNAGELRDDLRRYLASRPIVARRAGLGKKTVKFVKRHQIAVLGCVSLIVAVSLTLAVGVNRRKAQTERAAAINASATAEEAAETNELLTGVLTILQANPVSIVEAASQRVGAIVPNALSGQSSGALSAAAVPSVGTPASIAFSLIGRLYDPASLESPAEGTNSAIAEIVNQIVGLWAQAAWPEAAALLDPYVKEHPTDFAAQEMHMAVAAQLGRFEDIVAVAAAFAETPHSGRAFLWRGLANLLRDKPDETIMDMTKAVMDGEKSIWPRLISGFAWTQLGNPEEGLRAFDSILAETPDLVPAHLGRASALLHAGRPREGVEAASRALELESQNADALTIRGDCFLELPDYAAAEHDYRAAMDIAGRTPLLLYKWWAVYLSRTQMQRNSAESSTDPNATLPNSAGDSRTLPPREPTSGLLPRPRAPDAPVSDYRGPQFPGLSLKRP